MNRYCYRCGDKLNRPIPENANYIRAEDTKETEQREQHYALVHTDETYSAAKKIANRLNRNLEAVAAEQARPDAPIEIDVPNGTKVKEDEHGATTETADTETVAFSVPEEAYDKEQIDSPNEIQNRPDISHVKTVKENVDVQKTGLVCTDCTNETDEVIWGENE